MEICREPHKVIVDTGISKINGKEAILRINESSSDTQVLVFTDSIDIVPGRFP